MPTKRRRVTRNIGINITPAAIAAFMAGDLKTLHVALRWPPWLPSPLDVDEGEPPAFVNAERWAQAQEAREAILATMTPAQRRFVEVNHQ